MLDSLLRSAVLFDICILVECDEEATKLTDHNHGEGPSINYHSSSAVEHVRRWEGLRWRMCLRGISPTDLLIESATGKESLQETHLGGECLIY